MINSINSNKTFGSTITICKNASEKNAKKLTNTVIKNTDARIDAAVKKVLNGFQPKEGSKEINNASAFINDVLKWFTKTNIELDTNNSIWLTKINNNKFVYGNREYLKKGTTVDIDFNA